MWDISFHIEGEVVVVRGFGFSVGIVIDSDGLGESGPNVSGGPAAGVTAGIGGGVAFFLREAEGEGKSVDFNLYVASVTLYFDEKGFNGFGVTFGPGAGVAGATLTRSETLSPRDIAKNIPDEIDIPIPLVPSIPLF